MGKKCSYTSLVFNVCLYLPCVSSDLPRTITETAFSYLSVIRVNQNDFAFGKDYFFLNCFYVQDKVNKAVFATLHVDVAALTWPCEWVCIVQLV